jgi:hypothetical protein
LFVGLGLEEIQDRDDLFVQGTEGQFHVLHAREFQEIPQEVFHSVALLFDHVDFGDSAAFSWPLTLVEFFTQQVGVHVDDRERIFDLVR